MRQAVNYGANEGIDWAILTNGRQFQLYKIIFEKPIGEKLVFEIDFTSEDFNIKSALELLQYLHRDAVTKKSLTDLWSRYSALEPANIAGLLFSPQVLKFLKKELKGKYDSKFEDDEIVESLYSIVCGEIPLDKVNIPKFRSTKKKQKRLSDTNSDSITTVSASDTATNIS